MRNEKISAARTVASASDLRAPRTPAARTAVAMPPQRIDADVPAGVHQDSLTQAMVPFAGSHLVPTGQTINVSMNAPSPHLPFKEWVARGMVGGVGHFAAWPFRLVAMTLEGAALAIVDIGKTVLKMILIAVLIPAMLVIGIRLASHVNDAPTIAAGTRGIVHDGRHAVDGLSDGATDELPAETPEKPSRRHR